MFNPLRAYCFGLQHRAVLMQCVLAGSSHNTWTRFLGSVLMFFLEDKYTDLFENRIDYAKEVRHLTSMPD